MKHIDLEVRLRAKQQPGYPVEITCAGAIEFPPGMLSAEIPEADGTELYRWLFADPSLSSAWQAAKLKYPQRRIRFRIDADAPELHAIAWELLKEPSPDGTLIEIAAAGNTPFSRYIAGTWEPGAVLKNRPLRVLVAVANPQASLKSLGLAVIDPQREFEFLKSATAGNPDLELVPLEGPCTLASLEAALRQDIHVLHFIGHGFFNKDNQTSYLCLSSTKDPDKIDAASDIDVAAMVGRLIKADEKDRQAQLRLIYLSSCATATRSPADAFRGMAPRLVAAGVPAVLAMQDNVPIVTATEFSRVFYQQLLRHGSVDRAANAARATIISARLFGSSIPVLFLRLPDGQLLAPKPARRWVLYSLGFVLLVCLFAWLFRADPVQLDLWIERQSFADGEPSGPKSVATQDTDFKPGDGFSINLNPPGVGFLYLLNAGLDSSANPGINLLFPAPDKDARIDANNVLRIPAVAENWIRFGPTPSTEEFYLVFSRVPLKELDEWNRDASQREQNHTAARGVQEVGKIMQLVESYKSSPTRFSRKSDRQKEALSSSSVIVHQIRLHSK